MDLHAVHVAGLGKISAAEDQGGEIRDIQPDVPIFRFGDGSAGFVKFHMEGLVVPGAIPVENADVGGAGA